MPKPLPEVDVLKVHDTGKATLFKLYEGEKEDHWIPNVTLEQYVEMEHMGGRTYRLTGPEWLFLQKGLI